MSTGIEPALLGGLSLVALLAAPVVLALGATARADGRRARGARRVKTGDVDSRSGTVAVAGEVRAAGETATAPVSGHGALAYRYVVSERGHLSADWSVEAVGSAGVPFAVDDGSGPVLVDPRGARLRLASDARETVTADGRVPERVRAFLASVDDVSPSGNDRRYVERALRPNDEVVVVGSVTASAAGPIVRSADVPPLIVAGDPGTTWRRLRWRAPAAAVTGCALALAGGAGLLLVL